MIVYKHEVSHEWQRRTTLREFKEGQLLNDEVLDADFLLRTAAEIHGEPAGRPCPVCESDALRVVKWVHDEKLGRRTNTARSDEEIARLVGEVGPITVHFVEVCPRCRWNFLLKEVLADTPR